MKNNFYSILNVRVLVSLFIGMTLVSGCGGGGGNPGANPGSATVTPVVPSLPTLDVGLQGGGSIVLATGATRVIATLKDASGAAVAGRLVSFEGNPALIKFSPSSGQVLTDATGIASITVSPVSVLAAGASTLTASSKVGVNSLTKSFDFQLAESNVTFGSLSLGGSLPAYGTRAISIPVRVSGGVPSSPVQVSFTPNCGTVTPATSTTDSLGIASATFSANSTTGCAGASVSISASAIGTASVTGFISVNSVAATNLQFVSASPQLIYLTDSVGPTQSQIVFKVVDAAGNALANRVVRLSLPTNATGIGVNTIGGLGPVDVTSDSSGNVSVAVFSGTVPTSFSVTGTLLDDSGGPTTVGTNSNVLTVAVGRPAQRSLSLSFKELAIEGFSTDGTTTSVTLLLADRVGNPVPPGTQVNFVTEAGVMIPPTCFTNTIGDVPIALPSGNANAANATSGCTVSIRSQGTRPSKGLVSVMAYAVGEEDFIDANGNNIYDAGEVFTDLGRATMPRYLDNVATSSTYTTGDFQVPRVGAAACVNGGACAGDGVWGSADVRKVGTIAFATGAAQITTTSVSNRAITFRVEDRNGNSMPTGSQVSVSAVDNTGNLLGCSIAAGASYAVASTLSPSTFSSSLKECASGDSVFISVTSKLGVVSTLSVAIP